MFRRVAAVVVVVAAFVVPASPSRAEFRPVGARVVAPGVTTFLVKLPTPNVLYFAAVEPSAAVRMKLATPKPGADTRAPTTSFCGTCLVAVNGGFFDISTGAPVGGQWPVMLSALLNPAWRNAATGVQWLIRDGFGKPLPNTSFVNGRHPRTFVFGNRDGTIWFAAVDGRQPGHSIGMSLHEVAAVARSFGASWAVNLDGGCSTTFVVQGVVKNSPCRDATTVNGQRPVANAFVIRRA